MTAIKITAIEKNVVSLTFFILGASATVPSRLTKASPPFCCGSDRFIADACGILAVFGVSNPKLPSPAFAEGSAVGEAAAEEPASCGSFLARFLPSEVGVIGEPAAKSLPVGTSLSSTSAIFAATTCTDIAAVSESLFPTQIASQADVSGGGTMAKCIMAFVVLISITKKWSCGHLQHEC